MTSTTGEPRLYGNWRRASGFGIANWSTSQTVTVFVAVLIPVALLYVSVPAALIAAAVAALGVAVALVPIGGIPAATYVLRGLRFRTARKRGWTEYSGGVLTEHPRREDLPGPMGPMVPLETDDGRGGRQALVWDRRTGWITAVLPVSPHGLELADQGQADGYVAAFGQWLADLGHQQLVRHVAVTVDTAPSGGATVGEYVAGRRHEQAPAASRQIMDELVAATPAVTAEVSTHVAITFDPAQAPQRPKDLLGGVAEVTRALPSLEQSLAPCGVTVLGRASLGWLTGYLRGAYDPAARSDIARSEARQQVLDWSEAGPVRASEQWEHWRHDSGVSVTWGLRELPRQTVTERVWAPLLSPGPFQRRVTALYRPYSAEQAAREVESEIGHLRTRNEWARRTRKDSTQRELDDNARALQAAREESQGAGVEEMTLHVSTTVADPQQLPAATADVELRAGQAKTPLRRLQGAHNAGFAAALGVGIDPKALEAHRGI